MPNRTPKRAKRWSVMPGLSATITVAGVSGGSFLNFADPTTVIRMLGSGVITTSGVAVAGDRCDLTVAIGVVSQDAAALGVTALPDPRGEPAFPWLYWETFCLFFPAPCSASTAGLGPSGATDSVRFKFDIRSMRKIRPREALITLVEYTDGSGTPPIQFEMAQTRILLALH